MKKLNLAAVCLVGLALVFTGCIKQAGRDNPVDPSSPGYSPPEDQTALGTIICYVYTDQEPTHPVSGATVYAINMDTDATVASATSDAFGRVELKDIPASPPNYIISCPDYDDGGTFFENTYPSDGPPSICTYWIGLGGKGLTVPANGSVGGTELFFHLYCMGCTP